ncbi:MAG: antibiotic biosynthesis monooxygenase [Acidobacteriota bacterium]
MISRIWHGWTTHDNADAYQDIVSHQVLPGIARRQVPGYRGGYLLRRELEDEVEFVTILWFDSLDAVRAFVGEDFEVAHVPAEAQDVLLRFDARVRHYDTLLTPAETLSERPV